MGHNLLFAGGLIFVLFAVSTQGEPKYLLIEK